MTQCRNCGAECMPGNRFCYRCGADISMQPAGPMNGYAPMGGMQQGAYNPGMNQMQQPPAPQYGRPMYPPQQYPPQQYPPQQYVQRPPMAPPYMQQQQPPAQQIDVNTIVIHMSQREKSLLEAYSQFNRIPVEEFVRKAAMEKLNEEFDKKTADSAYRAFMENPETYTLEEVMMDYDL